MKLPSQKIEIGKTEYEKKHYPFYEVYQDGIYIANFNGVMTARSKFLDYKEGEFPLTPCGEEGFTLEIPKVPKKIFNMIWSFYMDVNRFYGAEATVLVYYDDEGKMDQVPEELNEEYGMGLHVKGKYVLYVPKQCNHAALTEYNGDELRNWLGKNLSIIMDTHSHNIMGAFFSGTDDENEKNFQFYAVFGRIGEENDVVIRYRYMGNWKNIEVSDVFDIEEVEEGKISCPTYPIKWWYQCTFELEGVELQC